MPREIARRSPCSNASYSASLLETGNSIWNTYFSSSPFGDMNSTPALPPPSLREPSKYIIQCFGRSTGAEIWFSHHSARKSTRAYDLMAVFGWNLISKAPSSTAHLDMRLVASRLWSMSANGKSVTTMTLYSSKIVSELPGSDEDRL